MAGKTAVELEAIIQAGKLPERLPTNPRAVLMILCQIELSASARSSSSSLKICWAAKTVVPAVPRQLETIATTSKLQCPR